jgi:hypothetical protein
MLNYKLNPHGDFPLTAVAPPNAIIPEQVICYHRSARRGVCGIGNVPSFSVQVLYNSKLLLKGILQD